jgi:hypothetical protein
MNILYPHPTDLNPTLEAYFTVDPDYPPEVIAAGQLMIALLDHLRRNVAGPDLRAYIQMFGLWFRHPDYPGQVRIEPRDLQLQFSYHVPDTWSGWDDAKVVGETDNLVTATEMLFSAFQHQPRPNDWLYHMLDPHGIRPRRGPKDFESWQIQLYPLDGQQPESFPAYYQALLTNPAKHRSYKAEGMLKLLDRLLEATSPNILWGSVQDTSLTLTDRNAAKPGVTIIPTSNVGYQITVPLASERAPWANAQIEGGTTSAEEAIHMIAAAARRQLLVRL